MYLYRLVGPTIRCICICRLVGPAIANAVFVAGPGYSIGRVTIWHFLRREGTAFLLEYVLCAIYVSSGYCVLK